MANVIITGGDGFVGANLQRVLAKSNHKVSIMDIARIGRDMDVRYLQDCFNSIREPSVVVHLAAIPGIPKCKEDPHLAFNTNTAGTRNVLAPLSRLENNKCKIIFASSGAAEESRSIYGATKRAAEELIRGYHNDFGLQCFILRFSNIYGPFSHNKTSFVAQMMKAAITGNALEIHGDGNQTRDFIYVDDICIAIKHAIETDAKHCAPIDISTGQFVSINTLTSTFAKVAKCSLNAKYTENVSPGVIYPPRVNPSSYYGDYILPSTTSLKSGLALTYKWFKENRELWDS